MTYLLLAARFLAPLLLGIILTVLLQDRIQWASARVASRFAPRAPRNVAGIWRSWYDYKSDGQLKREKQIIVLRQIGKSLWGKNITGDEHWYPLQGKLDLEQYLTGTWDNVIENDVYHGAFQFTVTPKGDSMSGKWLGFNKKGVINHGPWKWELLTRDTTERAQREALEQELREPRANPL